MNWQNRAEKNDGNLPLVRSYLIHHFEHAKEHSVSDHFQYQSSSSEAEQTSYPKSV